MSVALGARETTVACYVLWKVHLRCACVQGFFQDLTTEAGVSVIAGKCTQEGYLQLNTLKN